MTMGLLVVYSLATAALTFLKGASTISSVTRLRQVHPYPRDSYDVKSGNNYSDTVPSHFDEKLNEEAVNNLAESTINFLETGGFDFGNKEDIRRLVSFLEAATGANIQKNDKFNNFINMLKEGGKKVYQHTKEFASKHAKGAVGEAVKMAIVAVVKKGLPMFEKTYEDAMQRVPLNLRITYAPMAYNLWNELFKKFKITMPEELNPERFICKGMTKQQCDGVIKSAIMASSKKKTSKRNDKRSVEEYDDSDAGEEEENDGIDFNLDDF